MNNLSSITVIQNFIGSFSPSTFLKSLTPLQRKIGAIALGAIACFVAFCLACRYCLKEKKEEIAHQPAAPQPIPQVPQEEPKILPPQQAVDTDEIEPEPANLIHAEQPETELVRPISNAFHFFKKCRSFLKTGLNINMAEIKSKLDLDPDNPQLMFNYGEAHRYQNLHVEACDIFKKAWDLNLKKDFPKTAQKSLKAHILLSHSESLLMLEKHEEAIELLKQALSLNDANIHDMILQYYGLALQFQNKEKEAIHKFEEALQTLDPPRITLSQEKAYCLCGYGLLLCLQNKPQQAIEKFEAALKLDSQQKEALYFYGEALRMQGKDKEALEKFEAALTPDQFAVIKQEMENAPKI